MTLFVGIRIMSSFGVFGNLNDNAVDVIYTVLIEVVCLFLIPLMLYCLLLKNKPKQVFATCNYYKPNFKSVLISFALGFVLFFGTVIASAFFNGIIALMGYRSPFASSSEPITTSAYLISIVTTAILPAFCEEFLHRGMVLQGTKHMGFVKAITLSSILFGLIHLNIVQVFYATLLGFAMGYIAVISKNIWPAIIVHFTNNFMSITNDYLQSSSATYQNFVNTVYTRLFASNLLILMLSITIALVIIVFLFYFLSTKLYLNSIVKKVETAINSVYTKDGQAKTNEKINLGDNEVKELIESTTTLNLNNDEQNPLSAMLPNQDKVYKPRLRDCIFLIGSLVLGIIITIFTFVWGLL